jgi:tetratricopeptide (TPR) repeat protein
VKRCVAMLVTATLLQLLWVSRSVIAGVDEPVPPLLAGGDEIELSPPLLGRPEVLRGTIDDLAGESVMLRTRGVLKPVPLRDVRRLRFTHPAGYDDGLRQIRAGEWRSAIISLTSALAVESRPWVLREIRAELAACQRNLGEWEAGIREVEEILATDPDSRHVLQLPLVWDERLPAEQRYPARVEELQESSVARRLTAGSALLLDAIHDDAAAAALLNLRKNGRGGVVRIAELQLWRLNISQRDTLQISDVERLQERSGEFNRAMRGAGEFLCGRAYRQLGDSDRAAACLLWMPLAAPLDPATSRLALREAAEVLEESGRPDAARRIRSLCP